MSSSMIPIDNIPRCPVRARTIGEASGSVQVREEPSQALNSTETPGGDARLQTFSLLLIADGSLLIADAGRY